MSAALHAVHAFPVCDGLAATFVSADGPRASAAEIELGLASLLGEREAAGARVTVAVLVISSRDDLHWVAPACQWFARHGRRVVLRTAVALPHSVLDAAAQTNATALLELAHRRPRLQRALLGAGADSAATLLFQAQQMRAMDIPVAAHLGPLFPAIHDDAEDMVPLMQHVVAADVRDGHLGVGQLGPGRLAALEAVLPRSTMTQLVRAFGVDPAKVDPSPTRSRLEPSAQFALVREVEHMAVDAGLQIDACGCAMQCHLDHAAREFVAVLEPDLFGRSAG